jgi:hypothetical protein
MLLVFAHRTTKTQNSSEPDPVQEVQRQAERILGEQIHEYPKVSQDSSQAIPRQGVLTFLPEVEGITFQPKVQSVTWTGRVPPAVFLLSSSSEFLGRTLRGQLCVFLGNIVVAQVPLAIRVEDNAGVEEPQYVSDQVRWYRRIFASYSHKDVAIVQEFENHAIAFGDDYLRDLKSLRAGTNWNESLRRMIREADVFQLFWSHNSMNSDYVREEYNYALSLGRQGFIRPVYWEEPMPESKESGLPPPELQAIHFHRIALSGESTQKKLTRVGPAHAAPPSSDAGLDLNSGGAWYYANQGQMAGPVDGAAFDNLVRQGVVRDDTLVWKERMPNWKAYAEVRPSPMAAAPTVVMQIPPGGFFASAPAAEPASLETRFCSLCGRPTPTSQLTMLKGEPACPACAAVVHPAAPKRPQTPQPMAMPMGAPQEILPVAPHSLPKKSHALVIGLCLVAAVVTGLLLFLLLGWYWGR